MTLLQINNALVATGYPVAYSHFKSATALPHIVFSFPSSNSFAADDSAYIVTSNIEVVLSTKDKDSVAEGKVEAALKGLGLYYEKDEMYYSDEDFTQVTYESEAIING